MRNSLNAVATLIVVALSVISCEKKAGNYPKIDILTLPSQAGKDIRTVYTDSGRIQLVLSTPLM